MMMSGMMGGMIWGLLSVILLLLGFAYVVWVLANKESGAIKTTGQVIAILITIVAVVVLLYGAIYGGTMGRGNRGMMGQGMMGGKGMMRMMMNASEKERHELMEEMMKSPQMRKMMQQYTKREMK